MKGIDATIGDELQKAPIHGKEGFIAISGAKSANKHFKQDRCFDNPVEQIFVGLWITTDNVETQLTQTRDKELFRRTEGDCFSIDG